MILIADSGSTKTTWMEVESGNMIVTEGLNPHFTSEEQFMAACKQVTASPLPLSQGEGRLTQVVGKSPLLGRGAGVRPFSIHFYGAGCGLPAQRRKVAAWLTKAFGTSDIHVETDMLAACRATAGDQPALVGILGTGSNACLYDGQEIKQQPTSTGYILGDFGSANHVGRVLLNDYLTHRMSGKLRRMFHDTYHMSDAQLMDAVYHQPNPNRFLASLAPFAVQHINEFYCYKVVGNTLVDYWLQSLVKLFKKANDPEIKIHIVGGYAKAIEDTLRWWMEDCGAVVGNVVADPIEGLRQYHIKKI